jgi:hypothetical protein
MGIAGASTISEAASRFGEAQPESSTITINKKINIVFFILLLSFKRSKDEFKTVFVPVNAIFPDLAWLHVWMGFRAQEYALVRLPRRMQPA